MGVVPGPVSVTYARSRFRSDHPREPLGTGGIPETVDDGYAFPESSVGVAPVDVLDRCGFKRLAGTDAESSANVRHPI